MKKVPTLCDTIRQVLHASSATHTANIQGPAHGLLTMAATIGADIILRRNGDILVKQEGSNDTISLIKGGTPAFKRRLRHMCEWNLLNGLTKRVHTVKKTARHPQGKPERKDLQGITPDTPPLTATKGDHTDFS